MNLTSRIFTYFIGILLGSLMVYMLLIRGRERNLMGWLPGNRVTQQIGEQPLNISEKAACQLACIGISQEEVKELIISGSVNFSKSIVKAEPCPVYHITGKTETQIFFVQVCKEDSVLIDVSKETDQCDCD
jgi:hypothetical protein